MYTCAREIEHLDMLGVVVSFQTRKRKGGWFPFRPSSSLLKTHIMIGYWERTRILEQGKRELTTIPRLFFCHAWPC